MVDHEHYEPKSESSQMRFVIVVLALSAVAAFGLVILLGNM